jgi:hypothetical protein
MGLDGEAGYCYESKQAFKWLHDQLMEVGRCSAFVGGLMMILPPEQSVYTLMSAIVNHTSDFISEGRCHGQAFAFSRASKELYN